VKTRRNKTARKPARRSRLLGLVPTGRRVAIPKPRVPARRKGESVVAYHDRLSSLVYEATQAGDRQLSAALQARAGQLARQHKQVHEPRTGRLKTAQRRGPGSYPWYECLEDQLKQYAGDKARASRVCGRIRADSRRKYPIYWEARGLGPRRNPDRYAIVALPAAGGWHFWVADQHRHKLVASSTHPYETEEAAVAAAKKAAGKRVTKVRSARPKPSLSRLLRGL
jgi:hypothetical protein